MRWTLLPEPPVHQIDELAKLLSVDTNIASLLLQRGVENYDQAKAFFRPQLADLHDPFLMKDMEKAVNRILKAIEDEENILIFGDYDVDGTSSVALVASYLKTHYSQVATYIPDRYEEGYGVSYQGIDFAEDNNFTLIIALDCGVKAIEKVNYAAKKGVDFIICDHHRPGLDLPDAIAVLDPKREDCNYPYDELCGCGVGFKLVQALGTKFEQTIEDLRVYLDIVATAIAADIVPITGENRILAFHGMQQINSSPSIGIKALTHQVKKSSLTITDVVFTVAPRINAAGRMKHGNYAVELLMEEDFDKALKMASDIESFNLERREIEQKITKEAILQIQDNQEEKQATTVVYSEDWHKGVIGIVASRLIERYYRPTLVFTKNGESYAASARSVRGFDVYNALEACSEHITQFGGHKYAAGLTLTPENYQNFKHAFELVVKNTITEDALHPEILISQEIKFEEITDKFYRILKQFGPFGPQNLKPVFVAHGLKDNGYGRTVGAENNHLKLSIISENNKEVYNAIGFNLGNYFELLKDGQLFDAVFTIEENVWNGKTSIQLNLKDVKLT